MRLLTLLMIGFFLFAQAPAAVANVQSVPAGQSAPAYASYVQGLAHQKGKKTKKIGFFKKLMLKKAFGKETDNDGIVAAILALFLGGLGIHRVFLKSDGIIILWYILTVFGIFGLIPLIDFFRLLLQGSAHYRGNNSLFACFQ